MKKLNIIGILAAIAAVVLLVKVYNQEPTKATGPVKMNMRISPQVSESDEEDDDEAEVSSHSTTTTRPCITKGNYVAAISEKYLDDAVSYAADNDLQALEKLIKRGVVVVMKPGVKVYIVDNHFTTTEFRVEGQTDVLWTVREGIDCN